MYHALLARVVERAEELDDDVQRELGRERDLLLRAALEKRGEVEALDVLHRDEQAILAVLLGAPEVDDGHDVAVGERRRELGFRDEHLGELRPVGVDREDELHDEELSSAERRPLPREEDLGHAALPDAVEEHEATELLHGGAGQRDS